MEIKERKKWNKSTGRDYSKEKKWQASPKQRKYRAELNKYNRDHNTYGNGDGKDASHKGGKIVGYETQSKNRGRKEKSRMKKKTSEATVDQLKEYIRKQVIELVNEENEEEDGGLLFFAVKIAELGTILVTARSEGVVLATVARKLKRGKRDIVSIHKVNKSKGKEALKKVKDKGESVQRF
jgi:hypothetical protein